MVVSATYPFCTAVAPAYDAADMFLQEADGRRGERHKLAATPGRISLLTDCGRADGGPIPRIPH